MDINLILTIVQWCATTAVGIWLYFKKVGVQERESEKRELKEYTDSKANTGRLWVEEIRSRIEITDKHNEQKFQAIAECTSNLEKRVRVLEAQQVSREIVKVMLDDKVDPLEDTVGRLCEDMNRNFKRIEEAQALGEMNAHNIIVALARLEGKLEGAGIIKGKQNA